MFDYRRVDVNPVSGRDKYRYYNSWKIIEQKLVDDYIY
jgi:hypothetical protein